jgi:hypothetical protein
MPSITIQKAFIYGYIQPRISRIDRNKVAKNQYLVVLCVMSRLASFLILCLYLSSNSYASLDMHLCCGMIVDWKLNGEAEKCEGFRKGKKKCCDDLKISFEVVDNHFASDLGEDLPDEVRLSQISMGWVYLGSTKNERKPECYNISDNHAPPDLTGPSINIKYCVFRI